MTVNRSRTALGDCVVPREGGVQTGLFERAIAMIETEAARLRGSGVGALQEILGVQGLALDLIVTQLALEAAESHAAGYQELRLALMAQSQSRVTLVGLLSHARSRPAAPARRAIKDSDDQNAANRDSSA
jgi:hypothetical protein